MSVNILNSSSDVINYISTFLPAKDIIAFSGTCKKILSFLKKGILKDEEVYVRALAEKFRNKAIVDHIHTKKDLLYFCDGLVHLATINKLPITIPKGYLYIKHKNHISSKINIVNSLNFSKISSESLNYEIVKKIKEYSLSVNYLKMLLELGANFDIKTLFKAIVYEINLINLLSNEDSSKEKLQKNIKQSIFNICSILFSCRDVTKLFLNLYNNKNIDMPGYKVLKSLDFTN